MLWGLISLIGFFVYRFGQHTGFDILVDKIEFGWIDFACLVLIMALFTKIPEMLDKMAKRLLEFKNDIDNDIDADSIS